MKMKFSVLAACAKMRSVVWGEILFATDSLADVVNYGERAGAAILLNMH